MSRPVHPLKKAMKGILMKDDKNGRLRSGSVAAAGCVIFFAAFYVYLLTVVETSLIYQRFALDYYFPAFEMGWHFFAGFASVPAGIADYVCNFLSQWYYYNFAGAAVITAVAFAIFLATRKLLNAFGAGWLGFVAYLPAIAIAAMTSIYDHVLGNCFAITVALWFAFAFIRIAPVGRVARLISFAMIFALLYYLTAAASLVFAVVAIIYELLIVRKLINTTAFLLIAAASVLLIGVGIFALDISVAFLRSLKMEGMITRQTMIAYYSMGGVILLSLAAAGLLKILLAGKTSSKTKSPGSAMGLMLAAIKAVFVIAVSIAVMNYYYDHTNWAYLKSDYLARHDKWQELIELGKENPILHRNAFFNHDHNRALYYTGMMEEHFFEYPQYANALMLSFEKARKKIRFFEKYSDILLEMGHLNHAEKCSYEMLESAGDWPVIMNYLATVNLAKGKIETARVYLERLSKDLIHGNKARDLLARIDDDPDLSEDQYIQHLRSISDEADRLKLGYGSDDFFYRLLEKNPHNKMAFQYMMASFLVTRQVHRIADNIHRLDDFGYTKLPRYYEEALVVHIGMAKDHKVPKKWLPSEAAWKRAIEFDKIESKNEKNKPMAMKLLAPRFGDSYYYYHVFKRTGVTK